MTPPRGRRRRNRGVSATATTTITEDGNAVTSRLLLGTEEIVNPAYVSLGGSVTRNLGNYQSAKMEVHISLPCLPEDIDGAEVFAADWVEAKLAKQLEKTYEEA